MIRENVQKLLDGLPKTVELVVAAKSRTPREIIEAIEGGAKIIGENYVQEAEEVFQVIGHKVKWHFVGHLQKNKVKKAIKIFEMIETVDSYALAEEIDRICAQENKIMPVLVEINSGREKQKFGVMPEEVEGLIKKLSHLKNIQVMGLMTMGPRFGKPEDARPYFRETKRIFDEMDTLHLDNVQMRYLSMGMSNTYKVAIEEGANIVRIGSKIFGRKKE